MISDIIPTNRLYETTILSVFKMLAFLTLDKVLIARSRFHGNSVPSNLLNF